MKNKYLIILILILLITDSLYCNGTLYAGKRSAENLVGISLGSELWSFLGMEFDFYRSLEAHGCLGLSFNFTLNLPLNIISELEPLSFIRPYFISGVGYYAGNFYMETEEFWKQFKQYDSFGYGFIIMLSSKVGIRFDSRSIKLENMKWTRTSVGLNF